MTSTFPLRAALLSGLGAVLGAVLWVLIAIAADLERTFPAILIGVLAGAAPRLEPRRGRSVQILALSMTFIGLAVVQYFVVRHSVVTELVEAGRNRSLPMFLTPAAMWSVTTGWLRVYPIDAFFWLISLAAGYLLPYQSTDEVVPLEVIQERAG